MINNKTIAVVVPAYNEETQIGRVIETMPDFVDRIIIVNDCSKDNTEKVVKEYLNTDYNKTSITIKEKEKVIPNDYNYADIIVQKMEDKEQELLPDVNILNENQNNERIILISHIKNQKKGKATATGYKWCKNRNIFCTAVMDGDGQMDPSELESICNPIVYDGIDYVKGNRLIHRSASILIPKIRFFGNSVLSMLTKIASGYWRVSDTQTGYTAISLKGLKSLELHKIYKTYGVPNDILVKLNIAYCSLKEIEIKPVYNVGEQSKMNIRKVIPSISWLLLKSFFKRIWVKYFFRDLNPIFLFYNFALILFAIDTPFIVRIIIDLISGEALTFQTLSAFIFFSISAFQSMFFAMWMDIQDNDKLQK